MPGLQLTTPASTKDLKARDQALTRRNEELALLNQIGIALASSLELDEIMNKTLALLMAHFKVEAGEIFLLEEDGETLRLVLHRGEAAEAFWTRNRYKIGEGMVGQAAQTKQPVISNHLEKDERCNPPGRGRSRVQADCLHPTDGTRRNGRRADHRHPQPEGNISEANSKSLFRSPQAPGQPLKMPACTPMSAAMAVLEERERIGMDLHDGVIQSIYGVGLALENARVVLREDSRICRQPPTESDG